MSLLAKEKDEQWMIIIFLDVNLNFLNIFF